MHYLDEGQAKQGGLTYLCLHGNPAWSYLYRKMIPEFLAAGHRVVAPDLIGFGKSDKPKKTSFHSFGTHRQILLELIERLDLQNVVLVVQDWGGILGLTLPMAAPQRYKGLLVMNTMLATGYAPLSAGFIAWREMCANNPGFAMVPDSPDSDGAAVSRQAQDFWQHQWAGQTLMAVGAQDPVLGLSVMKQLQATIKGCGEPMVLEKGGHFAQEHGQAIAQQAIKHFKA
jgi:tRNA(adenine34) deaminase